MRRALLLFVKAAISILLLYFSLRWGNISAIGDRLTRLQPGWIVLGLGLLTAQILLLTFRWKTIAAASGAKLAFVPALQFSFIAAFFNQVLPSTVGGDGARIWLLARRGAAGWARATYSVLIDRIVGVFTLALVVIACLPWTFELIHDPVARTILLVIGFGAVASAVIFVAIGTQFKELTDRWALTRHLAAASRVAGTMLCFAPLVRIYNCMLDRNSLVHRCRSMVLREGDRSACQFVTGSVPHASRVAHFKRADIHCWLGRPRDKHDRRFRFCGPRWS